MLDGGIGDIESILELVWNNYDTICIMEDIRVLIPKEEFKRLLKTGYDYRIRNKKRNVAKAIEMGIDLFDLVTKCPLHSKAEEPFLWLEFRDNKDGNVGIYIIKNPKYCKE